MDYSQVYFGKPLIDLAYEDIERYFNEPKEENETIEYKSFHELSNFDKDIENVIRGINAFLNSNGGILIWGAPVGEKISGRKEKVFIGELSPVNFLKEKDALISIISGKITPLPVGISVNILSKDASFVYIFEIQSSPYKPHQFNDRYFVRLDGQSKPAPHYLIDALFKKITFPDIAGYIKFSSFYLRASDLRMDISVFLTNFSKFQNEENASFQLVIYPGTILGRDTGNVFSEEYSVLHYGRPVVVQYLLSFSHEQLEQTEQKIKIILSFGGKYSPAKRSSYTLDLNKTAKLSQRKNANYLISECEENLLLSEYQERIGKSKDTFIKDILER